MDQFIEEVFGRDGYTIIDLGGHPGDDVICDQCNKCFTDADPDQGGFIFGTHAVCPECAPRMMAGAIEFGEEWAITAMQPKHATFRKFVEDVRMYPMAMYTDMAPSV